MSWNEVIRPFLSVVVAYLLILSCLITALLPQIRSQILILYLILKNIIKSPSKRRLDSRNAHNVQFIRAYRGNLSGALLLMFVLVAVAFGLTTLLKPMLILNHDFTLTEILATDTLIAVMFAFIFIRSKKVRLAPLTKLAGIILPLIFLSVFLWGEGVAMIWGLILAFNPWVKIDR